MVSSHWQKQHIHFEKIVWGVSAAISILLVMLLLALGVGIEVVGLTFILVFIIMRVLLAFLFKNRYGNSMVRILKFENEEIERDFRMVFKNKNVRFNRRAKVDEAYRYEFPGHGLSMTAQPYWLSPDNEQPVTKVTLHELTTKNEAFAEMLAESIDEMANQRAKNHIAA